VFVRLHFLDMAVEYLRRQQNRLKLEFQIDSWPRYDYDNGESHGLERVTTAKWPGDEHDGLEMTAATAVILRAEGAYRTPGDNGALFMVLRNVRRPVADPFGGQHAVISAPRGLPRR
jgi:hypothetical protein